MSASRLRIVARWGINASMTAIAAMACSLALSWPGVARAQVGVEAILPAAGALADALPHDFVRLCLVGMIVMALVLLAAVTAFLAAIERQRKDAMAQTTRFTEAILDMTAKPCMLESEQGAAIMQQTLARAMKRAAD